jgi:ABC-type bacteriocin/lantibiotic exporter with double-glycine peptidase domain
LTAPASSSSDLDLRRIVRLFRPYRTRVLAVAGLIFVSAIIGLAQPFLIREAIDVALPDGDVGLLTWLVLGMVGAAIVGSALDVGQTWLSNTVGQRVMHDLRAAVYAHLQKLSLAFFTRTRSGEVQSRIANDIGGMQGVVTSTVTSFVSSLTTVIATLTAMIVLDWRLALATLAVVPFFVWLSRTVGKLRRRIVTQRQKRLADMSAIVEESLSISGIVLTRTMGRAPDLVDRFARSSDRVADLEVQSAMAGRWRMSTVQIAFAALPALVYWIAGYSSAHGGTFVTIGTLVAFTTLQTRLLMPMVTLLRLGVEIQTSLALFTRVFEYLDTEIEIAEPARPVRSPLVASASDGATPALPVRFEHVSFGYDPRSDRTIDDLDLEIPAGRTVAIVGETGSGKTTLGYLAARLYDVDAGRVTIGGLGAGRRGGAGDVPAAQLGRRQPAVREAGRDRRGAGRGGAGGAGPRPDRLAARRVRHRGRRARVPVLRWREAAAGDRPGDAPQRAGADPRRGDERARHPDRGGGAAGARAALGPPHHDRDRAPAVDGPRRRPDRRPRPRPDRRAGHPRRAAGARRALRGVAGAGPGGVGAGRGGRVAGVART